MRLPFRKKRVRRKSLSTKVALLVVVPVSVFLGVLFVYFMMDDFMMMSHLLFWNIEDSTFGGDTPGESQEAAYVPPSGLPDTPENQEDLLNGGAGLNGQGAYGTNGLNLALMNSLSGGYCSDWLALARDHCNKKYMSPDIKYPKDVNPSILVVVGTAMKETGLESVTLPNGSVAKLPTSNINLKTGTYGADIDGCKFDLYHVSSQWLSTHQDYISAAFNKNYKAPKSEFYGTFQLSKKFLSKTPVDLDRTSGTSLPSMLVGYGMPEERRMVNSDFGFFPDQISSNIQSGWVRYRTNYSYVGSEYIDFKRDMAAGASYAMTNAGQGNLATWFGLSTLTPNEGKLYEKSNTSALFQAFPGDAKGPLCADALNQIMNMGDKVSAYIDANPDCMTEALYLDRATFNGMTSIGVLYGCKNGFVTSVNKSRLISNMNGNSFSAGALIAYKAITGDSSMTKEGLIQKLQGLDTTKGDSYNQMKEGFNFFDGKDTQYNNYKGSTLCVHFEDTSHTFSYNGQTYTVPHAADMEPASGILWVPIGGAYLYYKMLTYAGVECTYEEAKGDAVSKETPKNDDVIADDLIAKIPLTPSSGLTIGLSIAEKMCRISYPTMAQGKNEYAQKKAGVKGAPAGVVCGNATYRAVKKYVMPGNNFWASCDAAVSTAVRWAGADDSFPTNRTYYQLGYCVKSSKDPEGRWAELDWKGNPDLLQPGDILIRSDLWEIEHGKKIANSSGHIVCFVDGDVPHQIYPQYNFNNNAVAHASYNNRPPCIGNFYKTLSGKGGANIGLSTFRAFRCVRPPEKSKFANYVPQLNQN